MDYNKFNDKYKSILEIFNSVEKPIVSEPFTSKETFTNKINDNSAMVSNEIRDILYWVFFAILCISPIIYYYFSTDENKTANTFIMFIIIMTFYFFLPAIFFIISRKDKEWPVTKTAVYIGFIIFITLLIISIPKILAMTAGIAGIDINMFDVLISLIIIFIILVLSNMHFNLFNMDKKQSEFYASLSGIILGLLVFGKYSSSAINNKYFSNSFWILSLILVIGAIVHNELNVFGGSFDKKNLLIFITIPLSILVLIYFLHIININIPEWGWGILFAGLIMFMTFINNEVVNVYQVENENNAYSFMGIIALIVGLALSGSIFQTKGVPNSDDFLKQVRDPSTGFGRGIGFRLLLLLIVLGSGYRYLRVVKDNISSTQQYEIAKDVILFLFPIVLIMLLTTNIFKSTGGIWLIVYAFVLLGLLSGYFYLLSKITNSQKEFMNYIVTILFILSAIICGAILFLLIGNYMSSLKGLPGIISNVLFYLPCLLIQIIEWIKKEVNNTTPTMGILFIIEIMIILAYFYLPALLKKATESSGIVIVDNPTKLDEQIELIGGDRFKIPKDPDELSGLNTVEKPRYNYSISLWTFINTNIHNGDAINNDLNIFSYDGKPNLKFRINEDNEDGEESHFIVEVTNADKTDEITQLKINLPLQKWHNFVFNYNDNAVDVFVNGELHKTYTFSENNRPTYDIVTDNLLIGDDSGLSGAICNAVYYTAPLTNSEIVNKYNLLQNLNPPIINL